MVQWDHHLLIYLLYIMENTELEYIEELRQLGVEFIPGEPVELKGLANMSQGEEITINTPVDYLTFSTWIEDIEAKINDNSLTSEEKVNLSNLLESYRMTWFNLTAFQERINEFIDNSIEKLA